MSKKKGENQNKITTKFPSSKNTHTNVFDGPHTPKPPFASTNTIALTTNISCKSYPFLEKKYSTPRIIVTAGQRSTKYKKYKMTSVV